MDPLPLVSKAYYLVSQMEKQKQMFELLGGIDDTNVSTSAYQIRVSTRNVNLEKKDKHFTLGMKVSYSQTSTTNFKLGYTFQAIFLFFIPSIESVVDSDHLDMPSIHSDVVPNNVDVSNKSGVPCSTIETDVPFSNTELSVRE